MESAPTARNDYHAVGRPVLWPLGALRQPESSTGAHAGAPLRLSVSCAVGGGVPDAPLRVAATIITTKKQRPYNSPTYLLYHLLHARINPEYAQIFPCKVVKSANRRIPKAVI